MKTNWKKLFNELSASEIADALNSQIKHQGTLTKVRATIDDEVHFFYEKNKEPQYEVKKLTDAEYIKDALKIQDDLDRQILFPTPKTKWQKTQECFDKVDENKDAILRMADDVFDNGEKISEHNIDIKDLERRVKLLEDKKITIKQLEDKEITIKQIEYPEGSTTWSVHYGEKTLGSFFDRSYAEDFRDRLLE